MSKRMCTAITVSSCGDCPFSFDPNGGCDCELWACTATDTDSGYREIPRRNRFAKPPDWCPLRENDRLVTLRVK